MTIKLTQANLSQLGPGIRVPLYDRRQVGESIVHVGVGGFHRAHQAVYADDLLNQQGPSEWGLCGVGLLPHDARMRDVLQSQDHLYTVVERSAQGDEARVIGSTLNFLYGPNNRESVVEKMASPKTRIVSLTITEGGYYLHQGTGQLDAQHPDIQHDLAHPHEPRGSLGVLLEALNRRRERGLDPFTAMSCDNIQSNGDVLKKMLLTFAELREPALSKWLSDHGAFPNSMVDRITPATTDKDRELVKESSELRTVGR
jgi:mannitol 2-dehydrogenase